MIKWNVRSSLGEASPEGIHPVIRCLLQNRGLDGEKAEQFLAGEKGETFSPALLPDIKPAAERISKALDSGEKITVYGDYDVDGITSVALLVRFFASVGASADWYIPDRSQGYGLNLAALDKIKAGGTSLVVTVDTGTTAVEEVLYAKSIGLDVVITDHHECGEILPDCPVVNPKRPDSSYPFKELAGVGVALKLVTYLSSEDEKRVFERYGEYAAIGTIADIMPLISENRVIVSRGLQTMKNPSVGIAALKAACCGEEPLTASAVAFRIAPRLNAAGRIGDPSEAENLLLCDDPAQAGKIAEKLCRENELRRQTEQAILSDAERLISLHNPEKEHIIVEMSDGWNGGVIGIVASRVVEKYNRPCILFCREKDLAKGSARSVPGVNIYSLLSANTEFLSRFGGHDMAAGMSLPAENFEAFRAQLLRFAKTAVDSELLIPSVEAECELPEEDLSVDFCRELSVLEPFGAGNLQPSFLLKNLTVTAVDGVSLNRHTRLTFRTPSGKTVKAMFFGVSPFAAGCLPGDSAEVIGTVSENIFRGVSSLSLTVKSLNLPDYEADFAKEEKNGKPTEKPERFPKTLQEKMFPPSTGQSKTGRRTESFFNAAFDLPRGFQTGRCGRLLQIAALP